MEPSQNHNIYILQNQQPQLGVVSNSVRTSSPIILPARLVSQPIFLANTQHPVQFQTTITPNNFRQTNAPAVSAVLCNNCGIPSTNSKICCSCRRLICSNPKIVNFVKECKETKSGISSSSFYSRKSQDNDFASFLKKNNNLNSRKRKNPVKKRLSSGKLRNTEQDEECITISSDEESSSTDQINSPDPSEVPCKQAKSDKKDSAEALSSPASSSSLGSLNHEKSNSPFHLKVTGIRIGEIKLQPSSVEILDDKLMCIVHCPNITKNFGLSIKWSRVITCDLCSDPTVPCLYLMVDSLHLDHLREILGMVKGKQPNSAPKEKAGEKQFIIFIDPDNVASSKFNLEAVSERMKQIEKESGRNFFQIITKEESENRQVTAAMVLCEGSSNVSKPAVTEDQLSPSQSNRIMTRNQTHKPAVAGICSLHNDDDDAPLFFTGDRKNLFVYPPTTGGITVTNEDLFCLNKGEFLNDVIIDFYLKYIANEKISVVDCRRTHIMSSFFYKRLIQKSQKTDKDISLAKHRHNQVKKWTRNVDLFEKDFIFVPINESSHWFMIVICFPSLVGKVYKEFPKQLLYLQQYGEDSDSCVERCESAEQKPENINKLTVDNMREENESTKSNTDEDPGISSPPKHPDAKTDDDDEVPELEIEEGQTSQEYSQIFIDEDPTSVSSGSDSQKSSTTNALTIHDSIHLEDTDVSQESSDALLFSCDGAESSSQSTESNTATYSQDNLVIESSQDSVDQENGVSTEEKSVVIFSQDSDVNSSSQYDSDSQKSSQEDPDQLTLGDSCDQEDIVIFQEDKLKSKASSSLPADILEVDSLSSSQEEQIGAMTSQDSTDQEESRDSQEEESSSSHPGEDSQNPTQGEPGDKEIQKVLSEPKIQGDVIEISVSPSNLIDFVLPRDLKNTCVISPHKKLCVSVKRMKSKDENPKGNGTSKKLNISPDPSPRKSSKEDSFILVSSEDDAEKKSLKVGESEATPSPGNRTNKTSSNERIIERPCILVLDSLKGQSRSRIVCNLREYLAIEWQTRKEKQRGEKAFNKDTMKMCTVPTPQQDNYSDCGIFLLHYVEKFFSNPIKNFIVPIRDFANWFNPAECKTKREELKKLILELEKNLKKEEG